MVYFLKKIFFFTALIVILQSSIADASRTERRNSVVKAVEKASPAVVNIRVEQKREEYKMRTFGAPFADEFFKDFFEPRIKKETVQTSLGSGVIITESGYIITNQHVIRSTSSIKVILADNREFFAKVVGADPGTDIAVLKIDSDKPLPYLTMGRSDDLMIGETVIAIGNPYGFSHTVTTGVLSAVGRTLKTDDRTYTNFLQTDAAINPGNSGGPLLNVDGDVIGINTALYVKAQGIGFAIPIDVVKSVADNLLHYGEVHKGWIGVQVQDITVELANYFGYHSTKGVLVSKVFEKSPAQKAGLKTGDIIVSINKANTSSKRMYIELQRQYTTGQALNFELFRRGEYIDVTLVTEDVPDRYFNTYFEDILGVELADIGRNAIRRFSLRTNEGVLIHSVKNGAIAYKNGIRNGDVIRKVDDYIVKNKSSLYKALQSLKRKKSSILLLIQRGQYGYYITMNLNY